MMSSGCSRFHCCLPISQIGSIRLQSQQEIAAAELPTPSPRFGRGSIFWRRQIRSQACAWRFMKPTRAHVKQGRCESSRRGEEECVWELELQPSSCSPSISPQRASSPLCFKKEETRQACWTQKTWWPACVLRVSTAHMTSETGQVSNTWSWLQSNETSGGMASGTRRLQTHPHFVAANPLEICQNIPKQNSDQSRHADSSVLRRFTSIHPHAKGCFLDSL